MDSSQSSQRSSEKSSKRLKYVHSRHIEINSVKISDKKSQVVSIDWDHTEPRSRRSSRSTDLQEDSQNNFDDNLSPKDTIYSVFGDHECGEPLRSQHIQLDFTPTEEDTEEIQEKMGGPQYRLSPGVRSSEIRPSSFSLHATRLWNSLPHNVRNSPSLPVFTQRVCNFWKMIYDHPELQSMMAVPNQYKESTAKETPSETERAQMSAKQRKKTAVSLVCETTELTKLAFRTKEDCIQCDPHLDDEYIPQTSSANALKTLKKRNKTRCTCPHCPHSCKVHGRKSNYRSTVKQTPKSQVDSDLAAMCQEMDEWGEKHPRTMDPPKLLVDKQSKNKKNFPFHPLSNRSSERETSCISCVPQMQTNAPIHWQLH